MERHFEHQLAELQNKVLRMAGLAEEQVRTAMLSATVGAALVHPLLSGLDDDSLKAELLALARRLLDFPAP